MESISVIIVNYNGAHHLKECLDSLKSSDYPKDKLEVIVFDNGSSDDSLRVIKKTLPTAKIIEHEKNIGFAAPHRITAAQARGDALAFLNNDMKVDKRWVREGVSLLDPSRGVVCSASKILSWNGKHTDFYGGSLQYLGYADQLKDVALRRGEDILFPCGGAMFIKKDVFIDSGCFDDDYFAIFEDVDLGWRLWVMGYRVAMAPDSIVYHKGHGTLDSKKEEKKRYLMHRNALMTIVKNYDDENLRKILPLAFVLAVKRALLFMGIDKRNYHFWVERESKTVQPDNYPEGCLHLAVLDDIFGSFESLMKKRRAVQDRRKREDREIFPLFRDPFRNLMGYKEYLWDEAALFGHFHLDELFQCGEDYDKRVKEGIYHARHTLKKLMEDMEDIEHAPSENERPPAFQPEGSNKLINKFYENLRQNGLGATVRKTGAYLRRVLR